MEFTAATSSKKHSEPPRATLYHTTPLKTLVDVYKYAACAQAALFCSSMVKNGENANSRRVPWVQIPDARKN